MVGETTGRHIGKFANGVELLVGKMEDWQSLGLTQYRDCDFIFIDTDHTYPAQLYQCITMWPLVRKGGMLMGHNYDNASVKKGTDEFCALMKLPLPEVINCEDTTQFFVIRKGE